MLAWRSTLRFACLTTMSPGDGKQRQGQTDSQRRAEVHRQRERNRQVNASIASDARKNVQTDGLASSGLVPARLAVCRAGWFGQAGRRPGGIRIHDRTRDNSDRRLRPRTETFASRQARQSLRLATGTSHRQACDPRRKATRWRQRRGAAGLGSSSTTPLVGQTGRPVLHAGRRDDVPLRVHRSESGHQQRPKQILRRARPGRQRAGCVAAARNREPDRRQTTARVRPRCHSPERVTNEWPVVACFPPPCTMNFRERRRYRRYAGRRFTARSSGNAYDQLVTLVARLLGT